MEFRFECGCGEEISDFTRSAATSVSTRAGCGGCGSRYALTVTSIANERPSLAIVRAVAAVTNTPVEDVEPLAHTVDPDALDDLLTHGEEARVSFEHADLQIEVDGATVVLAEPAVCE